MVHMKIVVPCCPKPVQNQSHGAKPLLCIINNHLFTSSGVIGGGIIVKSIRSGSKTSAFSEKFFVVLSFLSKSCNRKKIDRDF